MKNELFILLCLFITCSSQYVIQFPNDPNNYYQPSAIPANMSFQFNPFAYNPLFTQPTIIPQGNVVPINGMGFKSNTPNNTVMTANNLQPQFLKANTNNQDTSATVVLSDKPIPNNVFYTPTQIPVENYSPPTPTPPKKAENSPTVTPPHSSKTDDFTIDPNVEYKISFDKKNFLGDKIVFSNTNEIVNQLMKTNNQIGANNDISRLVESNSGQEERSRYINSIFSEGRQFQNDNGRAEADMLNEIIQKSKEMDKVANFPTSNMAGANEILPETKLEVVYVPQKAPETVTPTVTQQEITAIPKPQPMVESTHKAPEINQLENTITTKADVVKTEEHNPDEMLFQNFLATFNP
jgi:hypothetical protein